MITSSSFQDSEDRAYDVVDRDGWDSRRGEEPNSFEKISRQKFDPMPVSSVRRASRSSRKTAASQRKNKQIGRQVGGMAKRRNKRYC